METQEQLNQTPETKGEENSVIENQVNESNSPLKEDAIPENDSGEKKTDSTDNAVENPVKESSTKKSKLKSKPASKPISENKPEEVIEAVKKESQTKEPKLSSKEDSGKSKLVDIDELTLTPVEAQTSDKVKEDTVDTVHKSDQKAKKTKAKPSKKTTEAANDEVTDVVSKEKVVNPAETEDSKEKTEVDESIAVPLDENDKKVPKKTKKAKKSPDANEELTEETEITQSEAPAKQKDETASNDDISAEKENSTDSVEEKKEVIDYSKLTQEELVVILEETVQENEVTLIRNKVALIKVAYLKHHQATEESHLETFIAEGGDKTDYTPQESEINRRFKGAFKIYSHKRKIFLSNLEKEKQTNLESKKIILEELKALIDSEESLKKTYDEFKVLQDKWKDIGMVPKSEVNNLWQSYHFLVEKFFDKVKINRELRDLDMKKNLESKIGLCEKAEELLLEKSVIKSFKQLQQLHASWKEIGPVPNDKKEELWERFKGVTEKINALRREHYNSIKDEQKNNFMAKSALCERAEGVTKKENNSIKDWQANTEEMSELLKVWKTIGPAPRGQNDEIWERFRISLDAFFASKKEFYQNIKEEQNNNYNLKLDLCVQAEGLKDNTDWRNTTQNLINLQKDWKEIGPVPRKHSDKIWKRFRAACDEFFKNKSEYFSHIKQHEQENLDLKNSLISEVEAYQFSDDKKENLSVIKDFQRKFTEIGHVPFKEKEKVHNEFRSVINKKLDNLNIKRTEMQSINFKQKFDNLKDNPNAGRIINSERIFLSQKKKKLEEEAQLLENNVGFLAKSAKADLLKMEFMKKIESARNEIALISEKIRYLDKGM